MGQEPKPETANSEQKTPRILIAIPAFNEETRLSGTLEALRMAARENWEILIIDDGSSDRTVEIARSHQVKVIKLPLHLGYGGALQTAYKFALSRDITVLVQMDADGQHEPRCIADLLQTMHQENADVCIGNRFNLKSHYQPSLPRRLGQRFFTFVCWVLTGQKICDPTSGFKALNRKALEILTQDDFPTDFPDADVLVNLIYRGIRISETDVVMYPSPPGQRMHSELHQQIHYMCKLSLSIFMIFLRNIFRIKR